MVPDSAEVAEQFRRAGITANDVMLAVQEAVTVALSTAPIELPPPSDAFKPHVEIAPGGVLIVITRGQDGEAQLRAECEIGIITAALLPFQALAFREYILANAGQSACPT